MAGREIWPIDKSPPERRLALVVVIVFLVAGSAWILFSDLLLYSVIQDRAVVARLETAKGWVFVALAALLLYVVTLRSAAQIARANKTISAVVESIGDGVLLLGSDRKIIYANPASIRMLRVSNANDLRGMGASEFSRRFHVSYPDGHLVPPDQFVSQRVFDEPGPISYKAVLYPPGEPEVVIYCTAAGVRSGLGKSADLVVSIMHDITATEQLDRSRDELFTATAHAIKTPVAVIKSAAQVLEAGVPSQVSRSTAMIARQCARIERLVENLLALSRIRSGTLQLHPAEIDLHRVVEDVAAEIAGLSHGHDIDVRLEAHPRVRVDPERLQMVIRNTIHGATRSARPGGPVTVWVDCAGHDAEIGVSYQPDLSDGDPTTEFDDIGVGRFVTTMIVEAHGGTLTEQTGGGDTTVQIRLPVLSEGAVCDDGPRRRTRRR